jgi:hypothetical protein
MTEKAEFSTVRLSKLKDRKEEFLRNAKVSNDREVNFIVGDGTEEDAKKALERYHGSSSAAMLLDLDDNERTLEKIQNEECRRFLCNFVSTDVAKLCWH